VKHCDKDVFYSGEAEMPPLSALFIEEKEKEKT